MVARQRHQGAGTLAFGLWFFALWIVVAAAGAPLWGLLMVVGAVALIVTWTVAIGFPGGGVPRELHGGCRHLIGKPENIPQR